MSDPFARPRVAKVTVEVEGYDGQRLRFTYLDTFPGQEPDASTGIELEIATVSDRVDRYASMRHVHRLRIDNSPTYTVETITPPTPPTRARSERATPDELPAAPLALEAADE